MAAPISDSRVAPDQHGITRATFLRGMLATAFTATAGSHMLAAADVSTPSAAANHRAAPSPLDLHFSTIAQVRPFDLTPSRFRQVREWFESVDAAARHAGIAVQAEGHPAEVSQFGRTLRIRSSADAPTLFQLGSGPAAPYAAVTVTMGVPPQPSGRDDGGAATVVAGLVRDVHNYLVATFAAGNDPTRGSVAVEVVVDGRKTRAASETADLTSLTRVAFAVTENYVTALIGYAAGWTPVARARVTELLDLRNPAILRTYRYGFGAGGTGATVDVTEIEAGYFGEAGLRDLHIVSYTDGTPYTRDGKLYFTATQAGLASFPAAHWGVWTLDIKNPSRIEPVAKLFFARDGLVLGDHAGQILVDERHGGFHVAVSSWGDFDYQGVHVRYVRTFADVLHGVHVLASERLPLPTDVSSWDPAMARIGDRWYVGFVESPFQDRARGFNFHPALARSGPGGTLAHLSRVSADLARHQTEGVVLQKIGGRWYVLASDGERREYPVYDLSMRGLGVLNAPYGSNIPHPQIVPIPGGDRIRYLLITFDGTQFHERLLGYGTHGDFIVMQASEIERRHKLMGTRE
jgi:hypothetical protein